MFAYSINNDLKDNETSRIIILRPLPLALTFFVLGIVACFYLFKFIVYIYLALLLIVFLLFISGVIDKKLLCVSLLALTLSLIALAYKAYYNGCLLEEGYYSGMGTVASIDADGNAVIENVILEGEKLKGNVSVTNLSAQVGDNVLFAGNLKNYSLDENYGLHRIARGIYYEMDLSFYKTNYTQTFSFRNYVILGVHDGFARCSNETTADYLTSLMFGRSEMLDYSIRKNYIATGTAHVFAVSGLHVGVLASALASIFKKLKIGKNLSLTLLILFLSFYVYLCSFSPSVIRASLMVILSKILFRTKHYADKISVVSFSALVSLIVKPIWIGDISFILSYGAYVGILFLLPFCKKPFENIRRFKKITNLVAINMAVTLSLLPLSVLFFDKYSFTALIASFFIIPITSLLYFIAFLSLPFIAFKTLCIPCGWIMKTLVFISRTIIGKLNVLKGELGFSIKETSVIFWVFAMTVLSEYVNLNWKKKSVLSLSLFGLTFLL